MARVNIIEWIAKKLRSLTGIVEDGDTATHAISTGKYVIWKGNPCKASSAISIGDALSSSNLTALTDGVCNDLADETGAKVNKTDIVNNLTTNDSTKVLSAAQGYALNSKITKNSFDNYVDISGYTSTSNLYVAPSDGYLVCGLTDTAASGDYMYGRVYGASDTNNLAQLVVKGAPNGGEVINSLFVRKGMRLMRASSSTNTYIRFIPLT